MANPRSRNARRAGGTPVRRSSYGKIPVPQTGIHRCWSTTGAEISCELSGQDGAWKAGESWPVPRFRDNDDGTVTDRLTDLIWLKDADRFGDVQWITALRHARDLCEGERGLHDGSKPGDWRLPNIKELLSLVDYGTSAPSLAPGHPFRNVLCTIYWTSTSLTPTPTLAWMVTLGIAPAVFNLKNNFCRMWPVRGKGRLGKTGQTQCWDGHGNLIDGVGTGQDGDLQEGVASPDPRFEDGGDGTVTDRLTGLVWLKNANPFGFCRWEQALERCNDLRSGQHGLSDGSESGDWRLPNVREFETLVDYGNVAPSIPKTDLFEGVVPTSYWTSTTIPSAPTQAMFTILGVGPTIFENKEHVLLAWPLRGGKYS